MAKKLLLHVLTQEKELLKVEVDSVTVMTTTGEITVLPQHIPLFTKLEVGELVYSTENGKKKSIVVNGGFLDVSPDGTVNVLANAASLESDITVARAEAAKRRAEETMMNKVDRRSFMMAEASLRQALLELKIARRRSNPTSLS